MADVVNLNRFRKDKARADKAKKARENRLKHGRAKSDKNLAAHEAERANRNLDGKKRPENSDD